MLEHLPNLPGETCHAKFILRREVHIQYVLRSLYNLPKEYVVSFLDNVVYLIIFFNRVWMQVAHGFVSGECIVYVY